MRLVQHESKQNARDRGDARLTDQQGAPQPDFMEPAGKEKHVVQEVLELEAPAAADRCRPLRDRGGAKRTQATVGRMKIPSPWLRP